MRELFQGNQHTSASGGGGWLVEGEENGNHEIF